MKQFFSIALTAAMCGSLAGPVFAQSSAMPAMAGAMGPTSLTIRLQSQNDSGETGTATFVQKGPNVLVAVRVQNPAGDPQPIHVHKGTCATLDPKVTYPLPALVNRRSQTKIMNVTIKQLIESPYAVNVHKSPKEASVYVACGDIKAAETK